MPFITSFERIARKEALAEGLSKGQLLTLRESIRDLLEIRFGAVPQEVINRLEEESNPTTLRLWIRRVATSDSLETVLGIWKD